MVNDTSREELITFINRKLFKSTNLEFKNRVKSLLTTEQKFTIDDYLKISNKIISLEQLFDEELLWFAQAIEEMNKEFRLFNFNLLDYFTEHNVKAFKYYTRNNNTDDLYKLSNVFKISENQYIATVTVKQLALMKRNDIVRAVPEYQRQSKAIKNDEGTEILRYIHTNPKQIKEIEDLIVNDIYDYDEISLNLLDDGENNFLYNAEERSIVFAKNIEILIIDGNNRSLAAEKAVANNTEKISLFESRSFPVKFTFYSAERTKEVISQKWKASMILNRQKKAMERTNANRVVDEIRRNNLSYPQYSKYIVTTGTEIYSNTGFILYDELADAIERNYKVNEMEFPDEYLQVANWIILFSNELTKILINEFKEFARYKKLSWAVNSRAWYGYIWLSKQLQNDNEWIQKLHNIINFIDFDINTMPKLPEIMTIPYKKVIEEKFMKGARDYV